MDPYSAGARVLVIDDEPASVGLLASMLERAGYADIEAVTDPERAAERVREYEPDIVLLDLQPPALGGFAILEAIQAALPEGSFVPVIVLTADANGGVRRRALAAGAHDFLTKPFDYTEIMLRVRNLLRTRMLHQALRQHNTMLRARVDAHEAIERAAARREQLVMSSVLRVLEQGGPSIVYQPVFDLTTGRIDGVEALARFAGDPERPPDEWLADAASVGLGDQLELAAVARALGQRFLLPDDVFLAMNVSPGTLASGQLVDTLLRTEAGPGIVVELTEHEQIRDYPAVLRERERVRQCGARLAIDDAGAGFAGLQHILRLQPDIIKLDRFLVTGSDRDPSRRALIAALVTFSRDTGATLIAEGIETRDELAVVRDLGVTCGQGYLLARPAPAPLVASVRLAPDLSSIRAS